MFNADTSSINSVESILSATTCSSTPRINYKTCCFLFCKELVKKMIGIKDTETFWLIKVSPMFLHVNLILFKNGLLIIWVPQFRLYPQEENAV